MAWPTLVVDALKEAGLLHRFVEHANRTIAIRTLYTGVDSPSMALDFLIGEVRRQGGVVEGPGMLNLRSADTSPACRLVLCAWSQSSSSRPLHVFDDILSRIPASLLRKYRRLLPDYEIAKAARGTPGARQVIEHALHGYKVIAADLHKHGAALFNAETRASCHRHGDDCQCATFSLTGVPASALTVTIAGSTCVAWSTEGAGLGICHDSFLVWMIYVAELAVLRPLIFLHECVPQFPWRLFEHFLFGLYSLTVYPKIRPTELGHPMRRPRQFVVGHLIGKASSTGSPEHFYSLFKRELEQECCGKVFFVGSLAEVEGLRQRLAKRRMFNAGAGVAFEDLLPPGHIVRLQEHRLATQRSGVGEATVDLQQNEGHSATPSRIVPTLLTHSSLFNTSIGRCAVGSEKLVMQGIPACQVEGCPPCPFAGALGALTDDQMSCMAGNTINQAVAGALLGYVIATTKVDDVSAAAAFAGAPDQHPGLMRPTLEEALASSGLRIFRELAPRAPCRAAGDASSPACSVAPMAGEDLV